MYRILICSSLAAILCGEKISAAAFQNLDFESAVPPFTQVSVFPPLVPIGQALPGWSGAVGSVGQSIVQSNSACLSCAGIGVWDYPSDVIEGRFTAFLQAGTYVRWLPGEPTTNSAERVNASIFQTGDVPNDALSIRLKARSSDAVGPGVFSVSLGGIVVPLISIGSGPNYTLFAGDVFPWHGQTTELCIAAELNPNVPQPPRGYTYLWVDSIEFLATPVPEPGALAFFGVCVIGLCALCRRKFLATQ